MTLQEYKGAIPEQQALFAERFVTHYNGTKAAVEAHYGVKGAHTQASRLLKNVKVKAYIDALEAEKWAGVKIDPETQKKRLEWLQNSDIRHYLKFDGRKITFKASDEWTDAMAFAVKSIKVGKYGIELTLHDKSWSIPEVNRILGMYEKDNEQGNKSFMDAVAILLPDNKRGKIVPVDNDDEIVP